MATPKGYCSLTDVSLYIGQTSGGSTTLIPDQQTQATNLIAAAEVYIDRETRKGWLLPPVTNERYDLLAPVLYLKSHPVSSVQSIQTRTAQVGDTLTLLTAGTDYELLDPNLGEVRFASGYGASDPAAPRLFFHPSIAFVSYTPNLPVPLDITLATTQIVATTLYPQLYSGRIGIEQVNLSSQAVMTYTQDGLTLMVPEIAQRIIAGYRLPIVA